LVAQAVARRRTFLGREQELARLGALDGAVAFVHGIPGIGKTSLLAAYLGEADSALALDCRTVEPTEQGFLEAAAAALGTEPRLDAVAAALAAPGGPAILALDHYEVFRLMDTWLRATLLPALPPGVRLVLAGREPPVAAWFTVAEGFANIPLGPLDEGSSRALLAERGFGSEEAALLTRITHGHPLALILASAGIAEHPELGLEDAAMARVVSELARLYLEDVDDPLARRALEAAAVVRTVTEPLLAAMLGADNAAEALQALLELPFVDAGRDGLVVHEAVRDAVGGFLRGTNPVRHREYRRAAWRELRDEARDSPPRDLWRYTADMLYLVDNPVVREAFFPSGAQPLAVEPAEARDEAAVAAIARQHEPPTAAAWLERWWQEAPETFSVIRDRDGGVVGFFSLLDMRQLLPPLVPGDPVVDAWARHLRSNPLPKGQVALGLRRWLDAGHGESPCPAQAASWLDVKRTYMALRPALRRIYVVVNDVPTYWPVVEKLGFRPIGEDPAMLDGIAYASVFLDFGPGSVDGWLSGLAAADLGVDEEAPLDEDARELTVRGRAVTLTPLELGLFRHLREREGRTVSRRELLREVWHTEYAGGSNVVDAVVRSLRLKLGPAAPAVETVRGGGYRLRADWRAHLS
jgi:hypothetical protein